MSDHCYIDEATELFERFAARHELIYRVEDQPEVHLLWTFPVQPKLALEVTLGLQNLDELNFGVERFWCYFFPFEQVAERFEAILDAWVKGRARIGVVGQWGRLLQLHENDAWQIAYSASVFFPSWRTPSRYIYNIEDGSNP